VANCGQSFSAEEELSETRAVLVAVRHLEGGSSSASWIHPFFKTDANSSTVNVPTPPIQSMEPGAAMTLPPSLRRSLPDTNSSAKGRGFALSALSDRYGGRRDLYAGALRA